MVGTALVVFLSHVTASSGGLGFQAAGWAAVRIDDPADDPAAWQMTQLGVPSATFGITFGETAIVQGGYLLAFGADDQSHAAHLIRWPTSAVAAGDLSAPEWWTPADWVAQSTLTTAPAALFDGAPELSVQPDPRGSGWLGSRDRGLRRGDAAGAERAGRHRPVGLARRDLHAARIGAGERARVRGQRPPEPRGADLVATYAANSTDFATLVGDASLYYPRFVRASVPPAK